MTVAAVAERVPDDRGLQATNGLRVVSRGRYGSMIPAGRRKPDHSHQWGEPRAAGLLDRRLVRYCTVDKCIAVKFLRDTDGKLSRG